MDNEVTADRIEIRIIDTRPGIPDHHLEKVFKSFFSTKPSDEGSGLGLLLCRRIADRNGWSLEYSRT